MEENTIVLKDGENELTESEFSQIKDHPMYEAMVSTSGLVVIEEQKEKIKTERREEVYQSQDGVDFSDIDLEVQTKKNLIKIAESLGVETAGLSSKRLIQEIKAVR